MSRTPVALVVMILTALLAVPAVAQPANDDRAELLELRRAAIEELADIGRQLDQIQARRNSPDWVIVRGEDDEYVQVSLERVDELVPWVQMALADLDAAPALLRAIARRNPDLVEAAEVATSGGVTGLLGSLVASEVLEAGPELEAYERLKAGDIEGVDTDLIRRFIRDFFATADAQRHKADRYAAFEAQLIEQREALQMLLAVLEAALDEAAAAAPGEAPSCTEADMWCDDGDGAIEYDALKGLVECEAGDEACDGPGSDLAAGADGEGPSSDQVSYRWTGSWRTDLGLLRLVAAGTGFEGTLESSRGSAQVLLERMDTDPGDPEKLQGRFYGPVDGAWLPTLTAERYGEHAPVECPEPRRGSTSWGDLYFYGFDDDGIGGWWAPCDEAWRIGIDHANFTHPLSGQRVEPEAAASE